MSVSILSKTYWRNFASGKFAELTATADDASYKLEKKTGNGAYETVKTWDNGDLADAEFGEDYTDKMCIRDRTYRASETSTWNAL